MKKRQGKLPLWRPLKDWKRHEWAPMKEVWQRAEKLIGSDLRDMQHDLRQDFLDGRLIMGMRLFALDGTETRIILERECWQWLKINYAWSITGWEEIPGWKTEWEAEARKRKWERSALVVRRRELDKHYPDDRHTEDKRWRTEDKPQRKSEPATVAAQDLPVSARRKGSRVQDEIRRFAARKWPGGYKSVETKDIIKAANEDEEFKKAVDPFPKRDQFLRALGRRKG